MSRIKMIAALGVLALVLVAGFQNCAPAQSSGFLESASENGSGLSLNPADVVIVPTRFWCVAPTTPVVPGLLNEIDSSRLSVSLYDLNNSNGANLTFVCTIKQTDIIENLKDSKDLLLPLDEACPNLAPGTYGLAVNDLSRTDAGTSNTNLFGYPTPRVAVSNDSSGAKSYSVNVNSGLILFDRSGHSSCDQ